MHFHAAGQAAAGKGELNYVNYGPALTPTVAKSLPEWWGAHMGPFSSERVSALLRRDDLYPGPICNRVSIREYLSPSYSFSLLSEGSSRTRCYLD